MISGRSLRDLLIEKLYGARILKDNKTFRILNLTFKILLSSLKRLKPKNVAGNSKIKESTSEC